MKMFIFILIANLLFAQKESFKVDLKNLSVPKLNLNIIPTNNPDKIISKTYLDKNEIDAIKIKAKKYIPTPVTDQDIVLMKTSRGIITIKLFNDIAPNHCNNFKKLANSEFYDGTYFHRIIKNFMIQGGDINTRDNDPDNDGRGDPGWLIDEEFNETKHKKGILSMARSSDVNSAGSQFFICSADAPWLDKEYTAFGEVIDNLYAIDLLENSETERTKMLRSCFPEIAKGENSDDWIKVRDRSGLLYSKIPSEYSKQGYISYVKNQLNSDKPIAAPKIIKVRVLNKNNVDTFFKEQVNNPPTNTQSVTIPMDNNAK